MTYIVIENKKTRKRTYFTTAAAIEFIKKENPDIPTKVLNSWKTNDIILEYLKDYNVVVLV